MILTVFPASKVYATKLPPAVLNLATSAGECVGLAGLPEDLVVMKNSNVPEVPISSTDIDPLPFTVDPTMRLALLIPLSIVSRVLSGKFSVAHFPLL